MSPVSTPAPLTHFVFVDFENVPSIDLDPIEGKPVRVTLLLGEKQRRLEVALVRQIIRLTGQVTLIEVGASGRNALDLVLAAHLGRATIEFPGAEFTIVSKDKDFDPLIAHLRANGHRVERHPDFSELPFLNPTKQLPAGVRAKAHKPGPTHRHAAAGAPAKAAPVDKMEKLVGRLTSDTSPRPKRKDRLLHHISTSFGNQLSAAELAEKASQLVDRGVVSIEPDGKVRYPKQPTALASDVAPP